MKTMFKSLAMIAVAALSFAACTQKEEVIPSEGQMINLKFNIKPADESTYDNLVTILDEMQICCVGKYVIDNINEKDMVLLEAAGVDLSK